MDTALYDAFESHDNPASELTNDPVPIPKPGTGMCKGTPSTGSFQ